MTFKPRRCFSFLIFFLSIPLTSLFGLCHFDHCCSYGNGLASKPPVQKEGGFIEKHRTFYYATIQGVEALIDHYVDYYSVDEINRAIIVKKRLTAKERAEICAKAKDLDEVIEIFTRCTPGDYDHTKVTEMYLPVAQAMRHQLHRDVLQPLNVNRLTFGDHVRKVAIPTIAVVTAVGLILLLKNCGLLPSWMIVDKTTLYSLAVIVAAAGILYNYKDHIAAHSQQIELLAGAPKNGIAPGTDFGALVSKGACQNGDRNLEQVAAAVVDAVNAQASQDVAEIS